VTKDVAASVHQRLLNYARAQRRPFNEVLQYFALERFLYRLARSSYRSCPLTITVREKSRRSSMI
jgi:hypothetical protein